MASRRSARCGVRCACEGLPQRGACLGDGLLALIEHGGHAKKAVDHPIIAGACGRHPRLLQALGIGFTFIAERIILGRNHQRRRQALEVFGD